MEAFTYRKTMPGTNWMVDITPIYKYMCGENIVKSGRVYYDTRKHTVEDIEKIADKLKRAFLGEQEFRFNFDFSEAQYLQIHFNDGEDNEYSGKIITIGIGEQGKGFEIHG